MNLPEDKEQHALRLRAAAERRIDNAPGDVPLARPAEEQVHELRVYQIELEMQNEALLQAQIGLAESRDRYVDLYEFAPVGYLTLSTDGIIAEVNLTGATMLGRERKKLLQRGFIPLVIAADRPRWMRQFLKVKQHDGQGRVELALQRGDGTVFHAQVDCVRAGGGVLGVHVALSDITERKQGEAKHVQLEAQLRESQKMETIGQLAGGIAHDFSNALATILGNTELAREDAINNPRVLESLEEIRKAGARARALVQQILSFSRHQPTERKLVALAPILEETVRLLRSTLPAHIVLEVQCDADAPTVLADATQIEQVLINLATNALQAMHVKPGCIDIHLSTHHVDEAPYAGNERRSGGTRVFLPPGGYACLRVQDNGTGMDAATRARIFEPFFTTKPVGEGTGLGLAVVHGIVQVHEGAIVVGTELGKGTTFTIYLPAAEGRAVTPGPEEGTAGLATMSGTGGSKRILYLDDDASLVFLVQRRLERCGYQIRGYIAQDQALDALRADPHAFDLVVTDYNMPGMSGLEVARQVRAIRSDLPVVVASGFIDEELRAKADDAGVRELIFKAGTGEDLCEAVARYANAQRGCKVIS